MGEPEPVTGSYFVSTYPPFDRWTPEQLPAYREALQRRRDPAVPLGLYIHIPFCEERCDYCYYLSHDARRGAEVDAYVDALIRELAIYAASPALDARQLAFVYVGGGTPSLLSTTRLKRLLGGLDREMPFGAAREISFECAPRSATTKKLRLLRDFGVTRISMGVQQLDNGILQRNGRQHLVEDVDWALAGVRQVSFDIVNLDLIVGLRGESDRSFFSSLEKTLRYEPESLTIYQLEIPHNTPLFRDLKSGRATDLPTWDDKRRRLDRAFDLLEAEGYTLRSAYTAVRDREHDAFLYQDLQYHGADLIGLGASAFSYLGGVHQQNVASLSEYLEPREADDLPLQRAYELDPEERLIRELVLQLKLGEVDLAALGERFDTDVRKRFAKPFATLERDGFINLEDGRCHVTRPGLLRIDRLVPLLYQLA